MSSREHPEQGLPEFDLDRALDALRNEHGSEAQALALEQRLIAKLGPAALAGAGGGAAGAAGGGGIAGGWLLTLLLGLGGMGYVAMRTHDAGEPLAVAVRAERPAPPAVSDWVAPAPVVPPPSSISEPAPARPARARRQRARGPAPAVTTASAPAPTLQDELRLLKRSRAVLAGDPSEALRLAEQHAREFPHGMFVQEREVLAIEALLRKRERSSAFTRAEAFIASHGESPYALRIRTLLEQSPRGPESVQLRGSARAGSEAESVSGSGSGSGSVSDSVSGFGSVSDSVSDSDSDSVSDSVSGFGSVSGSIPGSAF